MEALRDFEERLGYAFRDPSLLVTALTLPSFRLDCQGGCHDNQRLEFLGDAVLGMVAAELLYRAHPGLDEGPLTALRSQMASGRHLADMARGIGLGACLRLGRGEERQTGRDRDGALSDALEAVIGAVYLDGGLDAVRGVVQRLAGVPGPDCLDEPDSNPKGELQERCQQDGLPLPEYTVIRIGGEIHAPVYCVRVQSGGQSAEAEGRSKREAERLAAAGLLRRLRAGEKYNDG